MQGSCGLGYRSWGLFRPARVHFTWWGVHKTLTARQKEEVGLAQAADGRLLTAGKKLVDVRHGAFRTLTSVRSRAVAHWRRTTLPYIEPGVRLLRRSDVEEFVRALEGFRRELSEAEAELDATYEELKADACRRLGKLFDPTDYPAEVRGLFRLDWDFPSVEPPGYLLHLSPEVYRQEQERVARRFEEAVRLAEQAFTEEFARLVAHLTERLSGDAGGERKVFRDSAVNNLTAFFDRFRNLSVGSHAELDHLVEQAKGLVRGVTAQGLRDDAGLRQHVVVRLAQVQTALDDLMVDRPRRRLVRSAPSPNGESHADGD
jgi:hypothetical protein